MRAHDNRITGYLVDGRARRIVLHTEDVFGPEPRPAIDLVFAGVEFYCFPCANLISVLLDVQEQPLRGSLMAMIDELSEADRRCGWPEQWDLRPERREMSLQALEARGARFFEIESSIGFEGWVVAAGFEEIG